MLTSVSDELTALCREQLLLLGQGLGASLSVVYLTEKLLGGEGTKLVPIVAEPEAAHRGEAFPEWGLPEGDSQEGETAMPLLLAPGLTDDPLHVADSAHPPEESSAQWQRDRLAHQLVLPLLHEGVAIGLLATSRPDRAWTEGEQQEIARVARTIALACVLDRRARWWESNYQQDRRLQGQKREILDNLLHQFRNPLTAVKIFGKLLVKRLQMGDPSRDYADGIVQESDRLQELVQEFKETLMWDREIATLPPEIEFDVEIVEATPPANSLSQTILLPASAEQLVSLSVASVLQPLLASARAIADDRQLTLHADIPDGLPPVLAHPQALREVLSNLIDNALKYTPAGGRVEIEVGERSREHRGKRLAIAISDTGLGIPPEDLAHLFERGYRGVQADGAIAGTGLGLAIARDLAMRMDGEIQAFSPALGEGNAGSTFIVWLPIDPSQLDVRTDSKSSKI